jgi:eukaryotic-like serine/threonine-protein kinase
MMTLSSSSIFAPPAPAINRVGRFHIIRELGRGSVGSVYLGHDPVIDREIAIKTFSSKVSPREKRQYEQQFINEARAAGRLSHPYIVTIFDASSEGGSTYIAMEYLRGKELSKLLDNGKQFTFDEIASIIWKLADALDYAHKNGVVHRDIKPANIFLVGDNQPKMVDFGIARSPNRLQDENDDQPYTLFRNNILGTPNYMSPEQAAGRPVDARTDIYSLGAIMYEMLTDRKPFQSNDPDKLLELIAYKAPPKPQELNAKIPEALSNIVLKAMSKRPEKRYQTADEMALDIKRYMVQGKRAKREMEMPSSELATRATNVASLYRRKLFWMGCMALTGAIGIACVHFLSRHST